ncbi:MAG: glycosyltransferase family 4 protein, partial [Arenimonas sp.]
IPLLDGYEFKWLKNISKNTGLSHFSGCDTPEIADIIRQKRFDAFMMFGWNRKCFLQAGWAANRTKTPLLIRLDSHLLTPRSSLLKALKKPLYSLLLPRAAHYLTPGERAEDYLRHYKVPSSRIHRLPHLIDTERFTKSAATAKANGDVDSLRRRHGAEADDFVFLFVGKIIPKKRPMLLLESLLELRRQGFSQLPRIKLWCVGNGPMREELEALARSEKLPVSFLGFVNQAEMPSVYAAANCLVLPSNGEETWGLVVNEAFACGLPAIVSNEAGCVPELIQEGKSGWVMNSTVPADLAGLFIKAFEQQADISSDTLKALTAAGSYNAGTRGLLEIVSVQRSGV